MRSNLKTLLASFALLSLLASTLGCQSGFNGFKSMLAKNGPIFAPEKKLDLDPPKPKSQVQLAGFESDAPMEAIWYKSFKEGNAESQRTRKPMLLLFTGSDWCSACTKLKRNVFDKPEFKSWSAENVILVEIDFPRRKPLPFTEQMKNEELKSKYGIRGYPTVVFVDPFGQTLGKLNYKDNATDWVNSAQSIMQR